MAADRRTERKENMANHLNRFREILKLRGIQAALITSEVNQSWLCGFDFTDGYVLVTKEQAYVITDFRYAEAAKAKADRSFEVIVPDGMLAKIAALLKEHGENRMFFEETTLSVETLEKLKEKLPDVKLFSGASAIIDGLREIKDADEIKKIAKAQDIADAAFSHILTFISPNMTEIDVALELEFYMRKNGASATSFDTIAVSGQASSLPHGVPRNVKLEKGFFTMDFGAVYQGYCSDMTRTVVLGKADAAMKKLYNTVLEAQRAGLAAARPGVGCREMDQAARDIINKAGYKGCFGHSLGHGVGKYIHENPRVAPGAPEDSVLRPGHVVTVEPGIYVEGKYGCRIEDMIVITEDGSRNFAHSPKELMELL